MAVSTFSHGCILTRSCLVTYSVVESRNLRLLAVREPTAVCASIDRFLQNISSDLLFTFYGNGARHPGFCQLAGRQPEFRPIGWSATHDRSRDVS